MPHKACVQQQHHECCARLYFFIHAIYDESSLSLIGAFREKFTKPVVAAVYTSIYVTFKFGEQTHDEYNLWGFGKANH